MRPNTTAYQGRTYYFSVVLKEKHSDYQVNVYYITVKMSGDPIDESDDEDEPINKTKIVMTIPYMNYHSQGYLKFNVPVNTSVFEDPVALNNTFLLYINNTLKQREQFQNMTFLVLNETHVNFSVKFNHPYLYGLLNKKNDLLIFEFINTSYIVLNSTGQEIIQLVNTKRIDMQFDFTGKLCS